MSDFVNRSDKDIYQDIEKAFLEEEDIMTDNVNVEVNEGKVTLSGTVETLEEKQDLEDTISDIPGVALINNDLQIEKI
ncbi:MAG: BON domain-containing protein [Patescibacteria group bacterium]|nr:BON domain-containing protein [Patescibacteria group bacterium]